MNAPPFPALRRIEHAAALGLAIGTLSMTATFGLRTAVFQPDYYAAPEQLATLGIQGAVELAVALSIGFVAIWPRREGVSKALLLVHAIVLALAKGVFLMVLVALGEPNPWGLSPGTLALCALVPVPLAITFLPVLKAVFVARGARAPGGAGLPEGTSPNSAPARDSPLEVRAALCVWLATVGLGTVLLGPDWLVRAWGSIALLGAAAHVGIGLAEERRLVQWARQAVTQGPPAYVVQDDPPPAEVPPLFAEDARKATLYAVSDEAGSYRQDPGKEPLAAIDPEALRRPRSFGRRVARRLAVPVVYTVLAVAISWPLLHSSEIAPRAVAFQYEHYRTDPYTQHGIEGLSLWTVRRGERGNYIVGYDPQLHVVVEGEALFRRVRGVSRGDLAELANDMLYNGDQLVLRGSDPGWPKDEAGRQPKAPYVEDGKLIFWRAWDGKTTKSEAPYEEGMIDESKEK